MDNSTVNAEIIGFGVITLLMVYVICHMLYNRKKGRDELESLFRLNRKKKTK